MSLKKIIESYDPDVSLGLASTIPAPWYLDPDVAALEFTAVFSKTWQIAGRAEQVRENGHYISCDIAGHPIVVVRGDDGVLRGFFNVCRHHAAEIMTECAGQANQLRCPYHGWTYSLQGELKAAPDLGAVRNFDPSGMGLVPVDVDVWQKWVLVKLDPGGPSLASFAGEGLTSQFESLSLDTFFWMERRSYFLECNWKVFVDNYLDGGYHVPHLHKGLNSVLNYAEYRIETTDRFCLQSSPMDSGSRALYYWIYPNFMINRYDNAMDTNLVIPLGTERTEVIFDFYFTDVSNEARARNLANIAISEGIQDEDTAICKSVQRGLASRSYTAGRLSARREAGEHLFHRLLAGALRAEFEERRPHQ